MIQAVSWQRLPEQGKIWVYVPAIPGQEPGIGLPLPTAEYLILQSYVDLVIEGGLEYGADYAREILTTTADWSAYWLNDRPLARRPWVYTKDYAAVDKLLAGSVPHFKDRLLAEPYAAKFLLQSRQLRRLPLLEGVGSSEVSGGLGVRPFRWAGQSQAGRASVHLPR